MRWEGRKGSSNVEDRRGRRVRRYGAGMGLGAIVIVVLYMLLGQDPAEVLQQLEMGSYESQAPVSQENDELGQFISVVLKDTEDVWHTLFLQQLNQSYREPTLVLFDAQTHSGCGFASAATGPFYCPGDSKVYIDLSFYRDLKTRFQAPGDFAMAYVVAHEVAHHVQNLLGITREVEIQRRKSSESEANQLSVQLELQADFLAGVWAHHAQQMKNILEEGDIEEALNAANAIGDDRLQMQARGFVVPESFTHGTSEQRMKWFAKGWQTGDLSQGDTFGTTNL